MRRKIVLTIIRTSILGFALASIAINAPFWVQFTLNVVSPLIWSITTIVEDTKERKV